MCVAPGLTSSLIALFSLPLTITDVSLAGAQVSMFQIPGIFHKLMLQPMTYLKCKRELKVCVIKQTGWQCYKGQQIQRGNYGLREKYVYVNNFLLKVIYSR